MHRKLDKQVTDELVSGVLAVQWLVVKMVQLVLYLDKEFHQSLIGERGEWLYPNY